MRNVGHGLVEDNEVPITKSVLMNCLIFQYSMNGVDATGSSERLPPIEGMAPDRQHPIRQRRPPDHLIQQEDL